MRRAIAAVFMLALLATPAVSSEADRRTFAITGEGSVSYVPDMARLQSAVVTEGKTAREALDANTEAMKRVFQALSSAGIQPADVSTSGFSVQPRYTQAGVRNGSADAPRIDGYEVQNMVHVRVHELDRIGSIIDALVSAGANRMSGISFDTSDRTALMDGARREAVADARRKAELYTSAAGVKLGKIVTLSENGMGHPEPVMMMRAQADSAVPIAAGERDMTVQVSIVWELED